MSRLKNFEYLILFLLCVIYFSVSLINFDIPCLNDCEAIDSIGAWQIISGKECIYDKLMGIYLFNKKFFPLMTDRYQSAFTSYLLVPFFALLGINVFSIRFCGAFFGAVTLFLTYIFAKKIFNKKIAFITILLLFLHPSYIFGAKHGIDLRTPITLITVGSLICIFEWYKGKNILYYYSGVFLLGLGISVQIAFIFFLGSLTITALLFFKSIIKRIKKDRHFILKYFLGAILFFSLGIVLFYIYNFNTSGNTIKYIFEYFPISRAGVDNRIYLQNLSNRLLQFTFLLRSHSFFSDLKYLGIENNAYLILFLVSLFWIIVKYMVDKKNYKKAIVLICLIFFSLLLSPFVVATLSTHHLLFLYPLPQVIIAYGIADFIHTFSNRGIARKLCYIFFSIIISIIVYIDAMILKTYNSNWYAIGGPPSFNTDAIYELASWLKVNKISEYVPLDLHLSNNIFFLTKGKCYPLGNPPLPGEKKDVNYEVWLKNKEQIYICRPLEIASNGNIVKTFFELIKEKNKKIILIKQFYSRNRELCFAVFQAR